MEEGGALLTPRTMGVAERIAGGLPKPTNVRRRQLKEKDRINVVKIGPNKKRKPQLSDFYAHHVSKPQLSSDSNPAYVDPQQTYGSILRTHPCLRTRTSYDFRFMNRCHYCGRYGDDSVIIAQHRTCMFCRVCVKRLGPGVKERNRTESAGNLENKTSHQSEIADHEKTSPKTKETLSKSRLFETTNTGCAFCIGDAVTTRKMAGYCIQCHKHLCVEHLKLHKNIKLFRLHTIVPL